MEDDQQFCLRWNNHQSTLIQNFDTLLESGTLVDCTLAAEGKYLKAHKVVLSACSPYFEGLLSEHYDKHPVFILKDVKFKELKAMMDYMYRGEVNISQDQLAALLKAAESLQIKGLSESKGGNGSTNKSDTRQQKTAPPPPPPPQIITQSLSDIPHGSSGLTIEKNNKITRHNLAQSSIGDLPEDSASPQLPKGLSSREGSQSPTARRRKRLRRRSMNDDNSIDNHEASNSSDMAQQSSGVNANIDDKSHSDLTDPLNRSALMQQLTKPSDEMMPIEKPEPTDPLIEPKSEYLDDPEESVEDLTLDDDMNDLNEMEQDNNRAGPSHDPSQHPGLASWHVTGDRSNAGGVVGAAPGANDEVFLAAQEAAQAHRDSQDMKRIPIVKLCRVKTEDIFPCPTPGCDSVFRRLSSLTSHLENSCGIDPKFSCIKCGYKCKYKQHFFKHMYTIHHVKKGNKQKKKSKEDRILKPRYNCKTPDCNLTFTKKSDLDKHNISCTIPPRYKCFYCDYLCKDRNDVEYHVKIVHKGEEMRFVDLQEAEGSSDFKSVGLIKFCDVIEEPFVCKISSCNKSFALESELINHQQSSCISLPERYKCPYCSKIGRFKCNIIRHITTHKNMPDAKPIDLMADQESNNKNNTSSKNLSNEKNHQINNKPPYILLTPKTEISDEVLPNNLYQCSYCDQRYKYKCILVRHIHTKHPEKNSPMINRQNTNINLSQNTERVVFHCPNLGCNRAFNYNENLINHRTFDCKFRTRFKCGYCDHSTNLRFNVIKHLSNIHPNEPSLIIDLEDESVKPDSISCTNKGCDRVFYNQTALEDHKKTECGVERVKLNYQCGHCWKLFNIRSSVIRHSRNKHKKKLIKIIDNFDA